MATHALIKAEAALHKGLLNTLIGYTRRTPADAEALNNKAWKYQQAANRAHPAVAEVLREAGHELAA